MFALKTIHLEKKVSNENQIILLFDLDSSCPCLYPMLYTMKFIRFQSISTQHADLIALKFWYEKFRYPFVSRSIQHLTILRLSKVKLIISLTYVERNSKN